MFNFKAVFLVISLPFSLASYQAQANHYNYNSQNYMVGVNTHHIEYSPAGNISRADNLKFINKIQMQDNIVSTNFGGVILRSDGTYDTTFIDGHNTPKTSKDRTYSDPYGNHKTIDLDIHNNIQVFGGGYSLFGLEYMNARWYFPSLRRFGSQDNLDVNNRFNLDAGNPIMNYDPSGHNALGIVKTLLLWTTGVDASSAKSAGITAGIAVGSSLVVGGIVGLVVWKVMQNRAEEVLAIEVNNIKKVEKLKKTKLMDKLKKRKLEALSNLRDKANQRIDRLVNGNKNLNDAYNTLVDDYNDLNKKNIELERENIALNKKQSTVNQRHQDLSEENKALNNKNIELGKKIINQNKKITSLELDQVRHQGLANKLNQDAGMKMMSILDKHESTIDELKKGRKIKYGKSKTFREHTETIRAQDDIIKARATEVSDLKEKVRLLGARNSTLAKTKNFIVQANSQN